MSILPKNLLAIDIVLLPNPDSLQMLLTAFKLPQLSPERLQLDAVKAVPHLTLAFGGAGPESGFKAYLNQLRAEAIWGTSPVSLQITSVYEAKTEAGLVVGLNLGNHPALQHLHERALELVYLEKADLLAGLTLSSLVDAKTADPITLDWIRNFPYGSGNNYQPHITLGFNNTGYNNSELARFIGQTITFSHYAVYQLGNYCTCQKLLAISPMS